MSKRLLWTSLPLFGCLSLVVSYRIAAIDSPGLSQVLVYPPIQPFGIRSLAIFLVVSVVAGSLVAVRSALARRSEWLPVLVWVVVALALRGLLRSLTPYSFETIFTSDGADTFYGVARQCTSPPPCYRRFRSRARLLATPRSEAICREADARMHAQAISRRLTSCLACHPRVEPERYSAHVFVRTCSRIGGPRSTRSCCKLFVPGKLYFFASEQRHTGHYALACACLVVRWLMTGSAICAAMLASPYADLAVATTALVHGITFCSAGRPCSVAGGCSWRRLLVQRRRPQRVLQRRMRRSTSQFGFDLIRAFP